jgi:hypothetical protein
MKTAVVTPTVEVAVPPPLYRIRKEQNIPTGGSDTRTPIPAIPILDIASDQNHAWFDSPIGGLGMRGFCGIIDKIPQRRHK